MYISLFCISQCELINGDISPNLLYVFICIFTSSGFDNTPTHAPFINTFVALNKYFLGHSSNSFMPIISRIHFIIGCPENPVVMWHISVMFLCNPQFAPSGVSTGSIIPHCELCNRRGLIDFEDESIGKFILRNPEINELYESRLASWTTPIFLVCSTEPQFPLNAFLNPDSTTRS